MSTAKGYSQITKCAGMMTWLLVALTFLLLAGCNGGSSNTGTLRVTLTDAPACGFDAVNVTVSKVRVHASGSAMENDNGWSEIVLDPARKINLLDLTNGALEDLGQTPLAAGHYTQLRLVLADTAGANTVIPSGAVDEISLDTPSGMQSGLKLIHPFDVAEGERVDLTLDFDACKSIVTRGNGSYGLKPVIQVIPFTLNGIGGFVDPALLAAGVAVSAQSHGAVVRATVPNSQTGEFFLARLEPAAYDVVVTTNDHATAVIAGVPIASATSTAMISTAAAPLAVPATATHTISGTITLNPPDVTVVPVATASQLFPSGAVTIKSQAVDLLNFAYTMSLPSEAPLYAAYGNGELPLVLIAQPTVAGQYQLEASAAGYQPQVFDQNIATADAVQDYILTP